MMTSDYYVLAAQKQVGDVSGLGVVLQTQATNKKRRSCAFQF